MIISALTLIILFYASAKDIKTKEIPNRVHLMLLLLGIFSILFYESPFLIKIIGGMAVGFFLLIIGLVGSLGGGDIKLGASFAFAVGAFSTLLTLIFGFFLAAMLFTIQKLRKKELKIMPMAPFFTIGFMFTIAIKPFIPNYYFII